jgi:hypothetical protein
MTRAGFGSTLDRFISVTREIARGMTDVGVGSGALLARFRDSVSEREQIGHSDLIEAEPIPLWDTYLSRQPA